MSELGKILKQDGWHISDGVDTCSGDDLRSMAKSRGRILELIKEEKNQALKDFAEKLKSKFNSEVVCFHNQQASQEWKDRESMKSAISISLVYMIDQLLEIELEGDNK